MQARLAKAMFRHVGRNAVDSPQVDLTREYLFQDELYGIAGVPLPTESLWTQSCGSSTCCHTLQRQRSRHS